MAIITGKDGTVVWGTVDGSTGDISVNTWTMNISREVINTSAFGDADTGYVSNIGGQISATATVSGLMTDGGAAFRPESLTGTNADCTLTSDGTDAWTFTAIITGSTQTVNRSGDATCSLTMASTGAIVTPA